jgi:hypothetical protein
LDLSTRSLQGKLDKDEQRFFKKLVKALGYLSADPKHNSLASHEIDDLTRKYGVKIFQSYLENNTPGAGRLFWAYGDPTRATSPCWRSSHIPKTKNAVPTSESSSPLPRLPGRRNAGRSNSSRPRRFDSPRTVFLDDSRWRRGRESNPRMEVLQTSALPLGYLAAPFGRAHTSFPRGSVNSRRRESHDRRQRSQQKMPTAAQMKANENKAAGDTGS